MEGNFVSVLCKWDNFIVCKKYGFFWFYSGIENRVYVFSDSDSDLDIFLFVFVLKKKWVLKLIYFKIFV